MVEPENLHISLSFLGETSEDLIEEISGKLDLIARSFRRFDVTIGRIKFIPNESYIRVLALDVLSPEDVLRKISTEIKSKIGGDVKPPHLTLCRLKSLENKTAFVEQVNKVNYLEESFPVRSIQIIKSSLQRSGPIYSVVHESHLSSD